MEALSIFLVVIFLGTLVYFLVKDPTSFMFFALFLFVLGFILYHFKVIRFKGTETYVNSGSPDAASGSSGFSPLQKLEVFYVSDNKFTYDEAEAVCKAYGAELATYNDVEEAYNDGGEWCGYGWSVGGLALFPTQEATFNSLRETGDPEKAKSCGRTGINGGYFDKNMKFGVNCYGVKPGKTYNVINKEKAKTDANVERIKQMIGTMIVDPFDKTKWSEYDNISSSESSYGGADINSGTTIERGIINKNITQTGQEDTGEEDTGEEDTGEEDTGEEDTGEEDTGEDPETQINGGTPIKNPGGIPSTGIVAPSSGGTGTSTVPPTTTTTTIPIKKETSVGDDISTFVSDMFSKIDGWLTGEGKTSIEDVGTTFLRGLDNFFTKIGSMFSDGFDTMKGDFKEAKKSDIFGDFGSMIDSGYESIKTDFGALSSKSAPVPSSAAAAAPATGKTYTTNMDAILSGDLTAKLPEQHNGGTVGEWVAEKKSLPGWGDEVIKSYPKNNSVVRANFIKALDLYGIPHTIKE